MSSGSDAKEFRKSGASFVSPVLSQQKEMLGSLKRVIKAQQDQTQHAILLPHPHAPNKWLEQQGARETKTLWWSH